MKTLAWRKRHSAWFLTDEEAIIWACIGVEGDKLKQWRGTIWRPEFRTPRGDWWVLGRTVPHAKQLVERYLYRNRCAAENFRIAA